MNATSPANVSRLSYRPELDVLRFSAFLGVFFYHAMPHDSYAYTGAGQFAPWAAATFRSGAFGVDLFFALSAYLITTLLVEEKEIRGALDIRAFYLRRILRIWPLYFAFLVFAVLLKWMSFRSQTVTLPYLTGYAFLAGNWIYVLYGLPHSVAVPLWSISIEEQFYLLWPLAVRKCTVRTMAWAACALLAASACCTAVLFAATPVLPEYRLEFNSLIRLYPIGLGILLALLLRRRSPELSTVLRILLVCLGVVTWVVVSRFCAFDVHSPAKVLDNMIGRPSIALASMAILAATLGARGFLVNRVTVYLGKISYGLYVIHAFGLVLAARMFERPSLPFGGASTVIVGLLSTIVLAALSYRWLESPFLSLKNRFAHISSSPEQSSTANSSNRCVDGSDRESKGLIARYDHAQDTARPA